MCVCVCVCVCVKFYYKLGKNFTETFQLLNQTYREDGIKGSPWPKNAKMSRSKIIVLLVVFWLERRCPSWSLPRGQMVNKQLYQEVLARLWDAVPRKRPELWKNQTWNLHHDNVPAHVSLLIRSYLAKHQTSVVPHPTYSPDLAPADFFLFPKLKTLWKDVVSKPSSFIVTLSLIRQAACAHAQSIGCSSTTNVHNETGQMAVCCQNLTLGGLSSRSALSVLVGALFNTLRTGLLNCLNACSRGLAFRHLASCI